MSPHSLAAIEMDPLTPDQRLLAATLAGVVNSTRPRLYLVRSTVAADRFWLTMYENTYHIPFEGYLTLPEALARFGGEVQGAILFDPSQRATVNVAANMASLRRAVIASPMDHTLLDQAGIEVVDDLSGRFPTKIEADMYNDEVLRPLFRNDIIANLADCIWELRDYLTAHSIFTFRYFPLGEDRERFENLLDTFPSNIPLMGYFARSGIEEYFANELASTHGLWWVPSDYAPNLSVHATISSGRVPHTVRPPIEVFPISTDTTYVTVVFSDGDNYSCALRDVFDRFHEPLHGVFPIGWTLPATAIELMPAVVDYYYASAARHDDFIPISGLGYAHLSLYADPDWFTKATFSYLRRAGNNAVWSLEPTAFFAPPVPPQLLFDDVSIAGYLFGYFANGAFYSFSEEGLPLVFTRSSYSTETTAIHRIVLDGILRKPKGMPQVIFLGINLWQIRVSELFRELAPFLSRDDVRIVPATALLASLKAWKAAHHRTADAN